MPLSDPSSSTTTAPLVEPDGAIGILGGGQLGRMLASAGARLGLKTRIFAPEARCPAADTATAHSVASYTDEEALAEFAKSVDVVTYEFENVPVETVDALAAFGARVAPGVRSLAVAQDRLREKEFAQSIGARTAPYHAVDDLDSLDEGLKKIGPPAILKTRRLGYDGKGQTVIVAYDGDLSQTWEKAQAHAWQALGARPSILEGFIPFEREISVIGARGADGEIALYDAAENIHRDGILKTSAVPASVNSAALEKACAIAKKMLEELDYVGVMGVEFFVVEDGDVLVNEIAPRVHNSGHWTLDACAVSQFEQHIRAVAGWPLGDPARHSDAVMENLIGEEIGDWRRWACKRQTCIHLYGKREARPDRKMGHVTRLYPRSEGRPTLVGFSQ